MWHLRDANGTPIALCVINVRRACWVKDFWYAKDTWCAQTVARTCKHDKTYTWYYCYYYSTTNKVLSAHVDCFVNSSHLQGCKVLQICSHQSALRAHVFYKYTTRPPR